MPVLIAAISIIATNFADFEFAGRMGWSPLGVLLKRLLTKSRIKQASSALPVKLVIQKKGHRHWLH